MKKYLLALVVFMFVGANASDNPYEISKNIKVIEQEKASLLAELSVIAERQEALEDLDDDLDADIDDDIAADKADTPTKEIIVDKVSKEEIKKNDEKKNEKLLAEKKKLEEEKAALEKAAAEQLIIEKNEQKKRDEAQLAKLQAEKEKLEKELADKTKAEKKVSVQKVSEAKPTSEPVKVETKSKLNDVNVSRDKIEELQKAEAEYKAAIKEMEEEH
ncbi:TolA protein [hydrothermal vent metagenome]|uniref:TolA protein n=1 Tax=hydrothermal vent metagenome TaxID=652676 RepID=A0A1W1EDM1_9ZZZZ